GLSQGGHVTLSAAALVPTYAPELELRAVSVTAPATVFEPDWTSAFNYDGSHIPFSVMLLFGWADHYGYNGPPLFLPDKVAAVAQSMRTRCVVDIFGSGTYADDLGTVRSAIFTPDLIQAYTTGIWGAFSAVHGWFDENQIRPFPQTTPIK